MKRVEVIQNCRLDPYYINRRAWNGGPRHPGTPSHARVTRQERIIERPNLHVADTNNLPFVDKYLMYGGPLKLHYGHLIIDSIIRLYAYNRCIFDGIAFCCCNDDFDNHDSLPSWMNEVLSYFNISKSDIVLVNEPTIVSQLAFPEPGEMPYCSPKPWYLDYLRLISPPAINKQNHKLFLGRNHLLQSGKASLLGESFIADVLAQNGYIYFKPENYSLSDCLTFMQGASHIVFTEGSSIYTTHLLSHLDAQVYMIPRRSNSYHLFERGLVSRAKRFATLNPKMSEQLAMIKTPRGKYNSRSCSFYPSLEPLLESLVHETFIEPDKCPGINSLNCTSRLLNDVATIESKNPGYSNHASSLILARLSG